VHGLLLISSSDTGVLFFLPNMTSLSRSQVFGGFFSDELYLQKEFFAKSKCGVKHVAISFVLVIVK
jgi:hypothetical protein